MSLSVFPLLVLTLQATVLGEPIRVDDQKQLFLDDYLIGSMENVARKVQPAKKCEGNPILVPTKPWEGSKTILYGSVLLDEGLYRMWYYAGGHVCYAESEDGLHWTKPELDVIKIDGRNSNMLLKRNPEDPSENPFNHFYELFGVLKDPKETDPTRRYKMGVLSLQRDYQGTHEDPFHQTQRRGLGVAGSPDGIVWTLIDDWSTEAICDGATHWMLDPKTNRFVNYGRTKFVSDEVNKTWEGDEWFEKYFWGRSVARIESEDFLDWNFEDPATAPVVMTSDPQDVTGTEIYGMNVFPYEGIYIGLVQVFHNQPETCWLDLQLAVSHDGFHFERVSDRSAFLPLGPIGSWDRFNNSVANNAPIEVGNELRFYYGGRTYRHSPYQGSFKGKSWGGIGVASVERDRFVALESEGGSLVTNLVILEGSTLYLNAKSEFGEIVIEAIDAEGEVHAISQPIVEDGLRIPVKWNQGGIDSLPRPVLLRVSLKNAKLFAVWCE